jgi:hypothetical protein
MGLDMYLEVRKFVETHDWVNENGEYVRKEKDGVDVIKSAGLEKLTSKEAVGVTVQTTAIYWRKVNAIHNWFVNTCANGVDECQEIPVERGHLLALRDQVDLVIRKKNPAVAQEFLPTTSGFFFGSTEYDDWYWSDMQFTLDELNRVLDETTDAYGTDFIYQASW